MRGATRYGVRAAVLAVTWAGAALPGWAGAGPEAFACQAGETAGLPAGDAATAVDIVCRELASVTGGSGRFEVSLRPLGQSLVLTVSHAGRMEGRSLVLHGFDEVPVAARRVAEALVTGRPIEATQRVDNLVESEGRKLVTLRGGRKFEMGALGLVAGQGTPAGAGFALGFAYDTPSFAVPAQLRYASSSDEGRTVSTFSIDTGARYFSSRRAASPFAGAGLSMLRLSYMESTQERISRGRHTEYAYRFLEDSRWGPGLYVEAGVQVFRLHRGRMTATLRADFPLYSLHPTGYESGSTPEGRRHDGGRRYIVPVTFGLTGSF